MAKAFVADLINDRLDVHGRGVAVAPGVSFATEPAVVVDGELAQRRAQLAQIEADFTADPEPVVRYFRRFYQEERLTADDIRSWIDTWKFALDDPDGFEREVTSGTPSFGIGDWFDRLRAYLHVPPDTSAVDQKLVDLLVARYGIDADIAAQIRPNVRKFETLDPVWLRDALNKYRELALTWPAGLEDYRRHESYASNFVYDGAATKVALMADFGTGYYHAAAIARQLMKAKYPNVFHLGDVYYGGRQSEFDDYFTPQLEAVVQGSELFGIAENHELYTRGTAYLAYFDKLRGQGLTRQEGSYFCVRYPEHQIIAVDVNWNGRQTFADERSRAWLAKVLADGGARTNILLTGSAPYKYGHSDRTPLLGHLWEFVKDGAIQIWFWGDDHYCALWPRDRELAPFIGSCIGHAGYPGGRRDTDEPAWARPTWVEAGARFPKWTKLRQDRGNNGWVELALKASGGLELTYVDWLGAKRYVIAYERDDKRLVAVAQREVPDREFGTPELHVP